ncbi:MAG: hypothetical protein QFB86_01330 [Patescibacteria group bacterium]|nr:hypothetical protein [Patescibacteria group bacterium]
MNEGAPQQEFVDPRPNEAEVLRQASFMERYGEQIVDFPGLGPMSLNAAMEECPVDLSSKTQEELDHYGAKIGTKFGLEIEPEDEHFLQPLPKKVDQTKKEKDISDKSAEKPLKDTTLDVKSAKEVGADVPKILTDEKLELQVEPISANETTVNARAATTEIVKAVVAVEEINLSNELQFHHETQKTILAPEVTAEATEIVPMLEAAKEPPIATSLPVIVETIEERVYSVENSEVVKPLADTTSSAEPNETPKPTINTTVEELFGIPSVQPEKEDFVPVPSILETPDFMAESEESEVHGHWQDDIAERYDWILTDEEPVDSGAELVEADYLDDLLRDAQIEAMLVPNEFDAAQTSGEAYETPAVYTGQLAVEHITAAPHLEVEQKEQVETLVQTMPENVQEAFDTFVKTAKPERIEAVEELTVTIAAVANRLHVLHKENRGDSEESQQIEAVLTKQYEALLTHLGLPADEETVKEFIRLVCSAEYEYEVVQLQEDSVDPMREHLGLAKYARGNDPDKHALRLLYGVEGLAQLVLRQTAALRY